MAARESNKAKVSLSYRPAAVVFLFIFLCVELAAINTGENLLYLLAAGTASFLLIGLLVTRGTLKGLRVRRDVPDAVYRKEPFGIKLLIENKHRFLPAMSLMLGDPKGAPDELAYIPKVPVRSSVSARMELAMPKRGVYPLPGMRISTGFPFGLFQSRLAYPEDALLVVYPRVVSLRKNVVEQMDDSGSLPRPRELDGDEFFAMREYVVGDDIRYICWRVSARMGKLIVRELEPSTARSVVVVFDTRGIPDSPEAEEQFEEAADLAASLAMMFLDRKYSVALVTPDTSVGMGSGSAHAKKILEMLARVEPQSYGSCGDDWFLASGDLGGAAKIFVASDPSRWGEQAYGRGVRVLNPDEVVHA